MYEINGYLQTFEGDLIENWEWTKTSQLWIQIVIAYISYYIMKSIWYENILSGQR